MGTFGSIGVLAVATIMFIFVFWEEAARCRKVRELEKKISNLEGLFWELMTENDILTQEIEELKKILE